MAWTYLSHLLVSLPSMLALVEAGGLPSFGISWEENETWATGPMEFIYRGDVTTNVLINAGDWDRLEVSGE